MIYVQVVVEDILQEVVMQKLLNTYREDIAICSVLGRRGNIYIRDKIRSFNQASNSVPHIVLTDLDHLPCAPQLINEWINFQLNPQMLFRIAEREVEAWLLADREKFSEFLGVPVKKIPVETQNIADPKRLIIDLARHSRKKQMIDILPIGSGNQGPGYNTILQNFVIKHWDPMRASSHNSSLQRAILRLNEFLRFHDE